MTKCTCGKNADIKEKGSYYCARCWIVKFSKTNITWRKS
jgi:hypothetical protein